ncbi:MAG: DNA-binding NarL/FixJ family response regulator [Gammaproteobacteria bacterium]|jgi:DNA-binding NarL/FixJ family response regulator
MKLKPEIAEETIANWQRIVDLMASIAQTPAGLIMRLDPGKSVNVFVTSATERNVWKLGDKCTVNSGLYCEEVINTGDHLLVPNALNDPLWDANPDLEFGMSFYLGFPLAWPDGEIFGTICVLDIKQNEHAISCRDLLEQFKKMVDSDLKMLMEIAERKAAQANLTLLKHELEHRIEERTRELQETNTGLREEIANRRLVEYELKRRESELREKSRSLEDANTALRVVIGHKETAKHEMEAAMLSNINELILPTVEKFRHCKSPEEHHHFVEFLESNLNQITSSFSSELIQKYANLTPTEIQVINFIKQGKKTKDIAKHMNSATSTIDFHRNNIRKKFGLSNSHTHLNMYLLTATR